MPDALLLLGLPGLLVAAVVVAAAVAVRAGGDRGVLASIAVLAPLSEAARAVRTVPLLARGARLPRLAAMGLLVLAAVRVLLLPIDGVVLVATPLGVGALVVLDLLSWLCWAPLARSRPRRLALQVLATELPVAVALAAPVVAARSLAVTVVADQPGLPLAAQMPVALVVLLAAVGLVAPWSAPASPPLGDRLPPVERLLAGAARAASLVAAGAGIAVVLLGTAGPAGVLRAGLGVVVILVVLVVASRRVPALDLERAARLSLVVLLPLAAVQLAVVAALSLLAAT